MLIAKKCPEFKINHIVDCIEDLILLVKKDTPISKEILQHCFYETYHTRKIIEIDWNDEHGQLTAIKSDTTIVDGNKISLDVCNG